jgi:hypothetical protein
MAAVASATRPSAQASLQVLIEAPGDFTCEGQPLPTVAAVPPTPGTAPKAEPGKVLSPTQARTFLNCSARWWFKYGLGEPDVKHSALALGSAVHRTLEVNFREKVTTKEDLDTLGVVALFRSEWQGQVEQTEFRDDEDPAAL